MMKSEKLRDFKIQEQKIQAVWNVGIRNIGITRAASQPSAKEKKTFDASGVFYSCEIASKLQHSIGKGLRESSVPNTHFYFLSSVFRFLRISFENPPIQTTPEGPETH